MGYLDDYDKRVFKDCKTKAIYKNNIMNNLANGRVSSSNTGKGFVVQKPTSKEDIAKTLQKYNLPMKDVFESINVDEFVNEINANGQNFEAIVVYGLGMNSDGDDGNLDDIDDDEPLQQIGFNNQFSSNIPRSIAFPIPDHILNPMQNTITTMTNLQQSRLPQSPQVPTSPDNDGDLTSNPRTPRSPFSTPANEPASSPGFPFINTRPATQSRSQSIGLGTRNTPSVSQTLDFGSSSSDRGHLVVGDVVAAPALPPRKNPRLSDVIKSVSRTAQKMRIGSPRVKPKNPPLPTPIESTIVEGDEEEEEEEEEGINLVGMPEWPEQAIANAAQQEPTDQELRNHYGQYSRSVRNQMLNNEPSDIVERVNALFGIRE